MADEDIHSANIKIAGMDDTGQQIKIRDQNRQTYSFFKNKKDGGETEAYKTYQRFNVGDTVMVTYKEVPYKNATIKNVMMFKQATGEPDAAPATAAAQWQARGQGRQPASGRPGREYWEKREAKRESSILMQVAFKAAVALQAAKIRSGGIEDTQWLYNITLEFYDWLAEHVGEESEEGSKARETVKAQREEARDDEIMF